MIKVIAGGRKSRGWVLDGVSEYEKRLSKYWTLEWRFVDDDAVDAAVAKLDARDYVIVMDERGANLSSPELSSKLSAAIESSRQIVIVIGGAYGVSDATRKRADLIWSLSKLVFPHGLVRVLLAEQVYRAQEIASGGKYHHE